MSDAQACALFWYLDQVLSPDYARAALGDADGGRFRALSEPWHALAVSFLSTTRTLRFQHLLVSFVSRAMASDSDFADAVLVQRLHGPVGGGGGGGVPASLPAPPGHVRVHSGSHAADRPQHELVDEQLVAVVREFAARQPGAACALLWKHCRRPHPPALLLANHLVCSASDRLLVKLSSVTGPTSLLHTLREALSAAAAAPSDDELGQVHAVRVV